MFDELLTRTLRTVVGVLAMGAVSGWSRAATADDPPTQALAIPAAPETAAGDESLGGPLVPGQTVQPIDLATALRLAGARDLDVALARERVCASLAELAEARVLWLPSLFLGPNWIRHDGQVQTVQGQIQTVSKSSLFLGGTAAIGQGVTGPVPAGGPAPIGALTSVIRFSDAIFIPLAAKQAVSARNAGVDAARNDALLGVAEAYFDLQRAAGRLMVAREAVGHADALAKVTASYARTGAGLEADHRRCLAERDRRRRDVELSAGDVEVASAEVVRRLRIDPRVVVAPVEPPVAQIRMTAEGCPIDDLITTALRTRPELAGSRALVEATLVRLKQARLRPFIPSLALRYSAGGFGGGVNGSFGNFGGRGDVDVNLFWEVQNLGLADRAIVRRRAAEQRAAAIELLKVQDRIAAEVVRGEKSRASAARQVTEAARAVPEAVASLDLNLKSLKQAAGLPGATRPIEVLQPIQALAQARTDYLDAVLARNLAEFRLYHAIGYGAGGAPAAGAVGFR